MANRHKNWDDCSWTMADARKLVEIARKEAVDYRNQYGVTILVKELTERVSMYMHDIPCVALFVRSL